MLQALDQTGIEHPIVVRFDGTNAEEGRQILEAAGRDNIHVEATMLDAATRAVELSR
jgi:succinyl-CoA synthetase beta subunit